MRILNIILTILVLEFISFPVFSATEDASKHFVLGKSIIEKNCSDCIGASKKGLEDGLIELELADSKGYKDKAALYKLKYQAYSAIAIVYSSPDSDDMKKYMNLRQKIAEKLVDLSPDDSNMLYEFAMGLQDKDEQLKIMRKVLLLDPKNFSARQMIGLRLIEIGKIDQAMAELKRAISEADPEVTDTYKEVAIEKLNEFGFNEKAAELRRLVVLKNH